MSEENKNHELSLDDIFSRIRKENGPERDVTMVPFKFLDAYTREDKNIFFGRDSETEEVFRKLYSGKLLLVYGKSGTGKSSIVNCGLISRIPQEDIYAINIRCGKNGYDNFVSEIKKHSTTKAENPLEILEDIFYTQSKPVALLFDQFEEIFILSDEEERSKLARELNAIMKSRLKINIILIIREEYFANLTEFEPYIPELYGNRIRIEKISIPSAKEAIIKPCTVCNVGIEDGLAERIIEQLNWQSEGLELTWLQIVMDKLYRIATERDIVNPAIDHGDLNRLGRIGNVLSDFVDEQLQLMPNGDIGEAILKTMVSADGTKKMVTLRDISDTLQTTGKEAEPRFIEEILSYLVKIRIINDKNDQGFYELRHDAIASRIYERMTAIEKEFIEVKTFLDNSFKIYEHRRVLMNDNDLKYIALFETRLILNDNLKDFIRISKKEVQKARYRRRNIVVASTIAAIVILSVFTLWALLERSKAVRQNSVAEEQKNEAVRANREAEIARTEAMEDKNKAVESEEIAIKQQRIAEELSRAALKANLKAESSSRQALEERNRAKENERLAVIARQDAENSRNELINAGIRTKFYLYQFNGKELANKSLLLQENDNLKALLALSAYDLVTYGYQNYSSETHPKYENEILYALQKAYLSLESDTLDQGEVWSVSSKSNKIAYSTKIGQLKISELDDEDPAKLPYPKVLARINLPDGSLVRSIAWDPAADRLIYGTLDGNVILADNLESNSPVQKIIYNHNKKKILWTGFCPGKNWLISTSADTAIQVWDLTEMKSIRKLRRNEPVSKFLITESEQLIFTDLQGHIFKWNLNNVSAEPELIYTNKSGKAFQTLAYSSFHKWLAVASEGEILIFRVNNNEFRNIEPEQFTLKHKGMISRMEFSPDNKWLVSASPDAIMLWNLRDEGNTEISKFVPVVIANNRLIFSLAFSTDSKYFFYGDNLLLHIYPVDIEDIYSKLKLKTGNKELTEQEWKYYVKGDLSRPSLK